MTDKHGCNTSGVNGIRITTDLKLEGVTVGRPAKVAVPDGAVIYVLLSEGSRRCEASVVG